MQLWAVEGAVRTAQVVKDCDLQSGSRKSFRQIASEEACPARNKYVAQDIQVWVRFFGDRGEMAVAGPGAISTVVKGSFSQPLLVERLWQSALRAPKTSRILAHAPHAILVDTLSTQFDL